MVSSVFKAALYCHRLNEDLFTRRSGLSRLLERDKAWHAYEERRFVLSPELSDEETLCYEHEYGIADHGILKVTQRRALMSYVIQELVERRCWRRNGTSVRIWEVGDFVRMSRAIATR